MLDTVVDSITCWPETRFPSEFLSGTSDGDVRKATVNADRAVFEAIAQALRNTGHSALRDLEMDIDGGVVVLWGRVPSYYQKQLAQETVQQVHGAGRVANGIEVVCCRYRGSARDSV